MIRPIAFLTIFVLLLSLAFIYDQVHQKQSVVEQQAIDIARRLDYESKQIEQEANRILAGSLSLENAKHPFYRIKNQQVVEWNSFEFIPDVRLLVSDFQWRYFQNQRGQYLLFKKPIDSISFLLSYVPLHVKFPIVNRYLPEQWNRSILAHTGLQLKAPHEGGVAILLRGTEAFSIIVNDRSTGFPTNNISNILLALSLISFGFAMIFVVKQLHRKKQYGWCFVLLTTVMVGLRLMMLWSNLPKRWTDSPLFDPQIFASSSYNSSVGDLLLNTLVVMVSTSYLFFNYPRFQLFHRLSKHGAARWIGASLMLLICYLAFLFPFLFIETLFHNSAISLEITQSLDLDEVRVVSWASILFGTLSSFFVVHVGFKIAYVFVAGKSTEFWISLFFATLAFVGYFVFMERSYWITLVICPLFLILLFLRRKYFIDRSTSTGIVWYAVITIVAFSLQSALATRKFSEEKRLEAQFRFGRNFLISKDILGEYLLDQASKRIASDPFVQSRLSTPFLNQSVVKNKIKQIHLSGYFDRYEVRISMFSGAGKSLDGEPRQDLAEMIRGIQSSSTLTEYEGIYFISPSNEFIRKYFSIIPVERQSNRLGFVVLELFLKKVIPHNVYPELLVDNRFSQYFSADEFSYAFFQNGKNELSFGNFNYTNFDVKKLGDAAIYTTGIKSKEMLHSAMEDEYGRVVIVSSESFPVSFLVTNFSFYFIASLILLGFILVAVLIILYHKIQISYSLRIQVFSYAAFVLPLVVVTFAVLSAMSRTTEREIRKEFETKSRLFANQLSTVIQSASQDSVSYQEVFSQQLSSLTRVAAIDATIYDTTGLMISTTQPLIFEHGLISTRIHPAALRAILNDGESAVTTSERIGILNYNNVYAALKNPVSGTVLGIVSLPFFDSLASFERTRINTLSLMLTIFVVVFILFSLLSTYAVTWLTFPLQYITKTLKVTTFQGRNTKMKWQKNDEIGMMVKEYNQMVDNLEQSREALALSQKEAAWREMAKQVAHEIKNPLTPMKLTIQQMQMALHKDQLPKEKLANSLESLLTQVDILNDIASSFNSFARMPAPNLQRVELNSLVHKTIELYQHDDVVIDFNNQSETWIMGDEQLLTRIFSNLILNGMQSVKEGVKPILTIRMRIVNSFCEVSVKDNGEGIDEEIRDRVFIPHFSTKKSGSGLGLAIAKQGIEQSGGNIWFETTLQNGTTFYLQLPLA